MLRLQVIGLALLLSPVWFPNSLNAQQTRGDLRSEALQAMKDAASFYREKLSSHGGYVYHYSLDLQQRWGEGAVSADTILVQPPGTPTVGMAFLKAHAATGDAFYLEAAREAAEALVAGQLESGGWTQVIHFAKPERGRMGQYRHRRGGDWNASSLDDGQTQAALQFLMLADQALGFMHPQIHQATLDGLDALLDAQFPNGAFPQVWTGPVDRRPIAKAKYPEYDWRTEGRIKNYWDQYTLNDNLAGDVAETLITAEAVYQDQRYRRAIEKLGDFLILAQMPAAQPGWCQQYNSDMVPIWARKFEPPAITGGESQDAMRTLIRIARHTGKKQYLEPIPRALAYFQQNLLPDGRLARYYELKTNKPLYMDRNYQLTYDDSAVPSHYAWKLSSQLDKIARQYDDAQHDRSRPGKAEALEPEIKQIINELDSEGRWVSVYKGESLVGQPPFTESFRYISSARFSRNLEILSEYIASTQ